jgi:hypothetical protein
MVRRWLRRTGTKTVALAAGQKSAPITFEKLITNENERLHREEPKEAPPAKSAIAKAGVLGEPWVCFTDRDRLGLALSGGGIRSATFNLGLMQALESQSLLKEVHYLSTVSGGGYIGGFWTAWLHPRPTSSSNEPQKPKSTFPAKTKETTSGSKPALINTPEPASIRHLREFSRFLMPRLGFFQSETWDGIVAILGGLLPGLLAATALIALVYYAWFLAALELAAGSVAFTSIIVFLLTLTIHLSAEHAWHISDKRGQTTEHFSRYVVLAAAVSLVTALLWVYLVSCQGTHIQAWLDGVGVSSPLGKESQAAANTISRLPWLDGLSVSSPSGKGSQPLARMISRVPFGLSAVWALVAVLLLFVRAACALGRSRRWTNLSRMLERATSRLFAPAMIWAAFALIWEVGRWVQTSSNVAAGTAAGSAAACSLLFVWLRDWLGKPPQETNATQLLKKAAATLKPLAPQVLANVAVALFFLVVCLLLQRFGLGFNLPYGIGGASLVLGLTLFFFNPAQVGLHDFYRSRICRCYLGAATLRDYSNYCRPTAEQPTDDLTLGVLHDNGASRPIHLICCTANNLSGDPLGSLYRGGRSATVSPFGLSLGDISARRDQLHLSSALTASAAAFNSQMGTLSMRLGPAVSFLMCAFNLRLGLWVSHPSNPHEKLFPPGLPFFCEMFGRTNCDPPPPPPPPPPHTDESVASGVDQTKKPSPATGRSARMLHLSDGGHFENLAVYELVRRHCRYLIVSDCGEDPQVTFDDLANALRRIREDFGVEIELDISPLRLDANGLARQDAVVGTIHYDGFAGSDKGTFIYIKPALTGDEPPDVLEYKKRNGSFPHETTGDQFYDEPQWESYRRLGEHVGNVVFQYVEERHELPGKGSRFVQEVFHDAIERWSPRPDRQGEVFLALNERCSTLDAAVRQDAPPALRAEFFPEVGETGLPVPQQTVLPDDEVRTVFFLMQAAQIMEDAWGAAHLATQWSHPVNEGWMHYFERWASTPSFRRWWPLLSPIYSARFRDFVRDRFDIVVEDSGARIKPAVPGAVLKLTRLKTVAELQSGFAWKQWVARGGEPNVKHLESRGFHAFDYNLTLAPGRDEKHLQVGFLLYQHHPVDSNLKDAKYVEWSSRELFVPYPLIGAGITTCLLDRVIKYFKHHGPSDLRVVMDQGLAIRGDEPRTQFPDPGSRRQRAHDISFYKSRGFTYFSSDTPGTLQRLL